MKKILSVIYFILLVVCSIELFAQDDFYLDSRLTTGANNGTSWANAWRSVANVNWGSMGAGDTLYISGRDTGGANDSSMYGAIDVGTSGSWNNYFVMIPGKYSASPSGHSGRVIIDLNFANDQGIEITSRSWVYVKGFEIRRCGSNGILCYMTARHIVIDSVYVRDIETFGIQGNGASCMSTGQDMDNWDSTDVVMDITIKNSLIKSFDDRWCDPACADDMVQFTCVRDLKIHDNIIINDNEQSQRTGEHVHMDDIQTFNCQGLQIYNNILIVDSACMGHNMIIEVQSRNGTEYSGVDECIIYNNLIYHGGHLESGGDPSTQHLFLRWYDPAAAMAPTYIFQNTFVWANGSGPDIEMERKGMFKNNIFYHDGTWGRNPSVYGGSHSGFWSTGGGTYCADFSTQVDSQKGNLFWFRWTANNDVDFGSYFCNWVGAGGTPARLCQPSSNSPSNWAGWSSADWGGNGVHANPLFADTLWDDGTPNSFILESNSPAIDAGSQGAWIEAFLEARGLPTTDFFGNPRDYNAPDIGAIEYQSEATDTVPTFSFTAVNNANINTLYTATSPLTNADSSYHVWTTTSANFKINYNGTYNTSMKTADPTNGADTVYVQNTTGGSYETPYIETIVAGGQSQNFVVTTKSDPGLGGNEAIIRDSRGKIIKDSSGEIIRLQ